MKKVGSLLLAVLMVLSLAACGKTPAEPTQTPSTQPSTETPTTEATEPALPQDALPGYRSSYLRRPVQFYAGIRYRRPFP